ncbi:MAG: transglutaminase domain-containing protein [Polyangiaceae bacterium]
MPRRLARVLSLFTTLAVAPPAFAGDWLAATPDAMIAVEAQAVRRADDDALAHLLLIHRLADRAAAGASRQALVALGSQPAEVGMAARWLARTLEPDGLEPLALPPRYDEPEAPEGNLRSWAILGPFEDTGAGLERQEGPETEGHRFVGADYSWGVYAVRPQRSLPATVTGRGLPLDLYVFPGQESCAYLSTLVTLSGTATFHIASSGSLRVIWDGRTVLTDDAPHERAIVDRAAFTANGASGRHELTLKVCRGARADEGRVRVHVTDGAGAPLALTATSSLEALDEARAAGPAPSRVERHPTLLERSVAGSDPTGARRAAVVLTLAGADDLRAARAPGLLDQLVNAPGVTTEDLALAGWLTSFVANRSGWLERALQSARDAKDDAVASFAQRALVETRLELGSLDLARVTASAAPLQAETDPEAVWLRAALDAAEGGAGLANKAETALDAIVAREGEATPVVVWDAIADEAGERPAVALAARARLARHAPGRADIYFLNAFSMLGADAVEHTGRAIAAAQPSAPALMQVGGTLLALGRYVAAVELLRLTTELAPNLAPAFELLARAESLVDPNGSGERVIPALERAVELSPQDPRLAAQKRFREGEAPDEPELGEDAPYLVAPDVFLARAAAHPVGDEVRARQLHWRRVVRLHPDRRVSQLMHYAREIVVEPRTEGDLYEDLPGGYGTELLLARVHREGATLPPDEQDSGGMVRWPKLRRGDVVEVAVRTWTAGPVGRRGDAPFYFIDYSGSFDDEPALFNEVIIDAPVGSAFAFDTIGGAPDERVVTTEGDRRITRLTYNAPPVIPHEPLSPHLTELVPVVVGSIYPSWDEFLAWYEGAVEGFTSPDEQIKRLAAELTKGKSTREEKVTALFDFVADDIRYVNYTSGEWWLPNRPQQLLARRQGDCDDKAMLLISLLRAVGIEAREVLIQTRYTAERRVMQSSQVAIPMFDHGIIYLPNESGEGGRLLDATSPKSRLGVLPGMDAGALALTVGSGSAPTLTPLPNPDDHAAIAHWTLTVAADGSGRLAAEETHRGDSAFMLRTHLAEADARAQWVEKNLVGDRLSGVSMEPEVSFREQAKGQVQVAYQARSQRLARREGDELLVPASPPPSLSSMLAPLVKRQLPVELPPQVAPSTQDRRLTIRIPAGYRVAALPPDAEADGGAFGKARVSFEAKGKEVEMRVVVSLSTPRISVADYPAWRRWLGQVDRLLGRQVRLAPIKEAPRGPRGARSPG